MENVDLVKMQAEQIAWSLRNFGEQPSHRPLLGMIEELAELQTAWDKKDKPEVIDAIGDVGIYMLDFCGKTGRSLGDLWEARSQHETSYDSRYWVFTDAVRKLAHHQLKGEQNIRGGTEYHAGELSKTLRGILWQLQAVAVAVGTNFPDVITAVWAKVSKRDWTKNPNTAHQVAEASEASEEARDE